jgi:hypothetical protein
MWISLRCQVSRGLFSGEVAIRGTTADGTEFSLFVSDDFVEFDAPVGDSGPVDGWLRVEVLVREGPLVLVRLPGQTFENGQTVTVRDCQLELRPRREAV